MGDATASLHDLKERVWGAANELLRAGFGIEGITRMLEGMAASKPAPSDPDGRLIWPEIVRLLSTGKYSASAILSHLRALAAGDDPRRLAGLAPAIKAELDRLVRDGATIDSIVAHLRAMGAPVSRSAVGRYKQKAEAQLKRYREAQEVAGVWVNKLGEDPKGNVGRLVQEMLKTVAFQTLANMAAGDGDDDEAATMAATPEDLMLLARAIKDVTSAEKMSAEIELRIRKEVEADMERAKRAQAEAAAEAAAQRGMTDDDVAFLRAQILGVKLEGRPT